MRSGMENAIINIQIWSAKMLQHFDMFPEHPVVAVPHGILFPKVPKMLLRFVRREETPPIEIIKRILSEVIKEDIARK